MQTKCGLLIGSAILLWASTTQAQEQRPASSQSPNRAQVVAPTSDVGPWQMEQFEVLGASQDFAMWLLNTKTGVVYVCTTGNSRPKKAGDINCVRATTDIPLPTQ